ncbi:MAG: glycosyltransferase family 2 protein [Tatlockia sp.]|nr:glycosyltransferase family 2 protein [Tatlockia sp.]
MAFIPFFAIGPTSLLGLIGLLRGPDKTVPTPKANWLEATVDLVIPSYNEEKNIILCINSILRQTLRPRCIFLIDDASKDRTVHFAKEYADYMQIELKILAREVNEGKTPSIHYALKNSDADVLAVLDGDTIFRSDNYLERLVHELYQGVGIATACGVILPFTEKDRDLEFKTKNMSRFTSKYPETQMKLDNTSYEHFQRQITNNYREELYLFLQRYIYHGEMVFFGTIIFPIGCASVYRKDYLEITFDTYLEIFGYDLTSSEDIFFGFAFASQGYRNIVVPDVYALSVEPRFFKMYSQILKWSSAFFQSCFYFNDLFSTPFKLPRNIIRKFRERRDKEKIEQKRKIKEAYRQPFGAEYTKKYGRNIGWFVFTSAIEKVSFPIIILILLILRKWEILAIGLGAEVLLYIGIITYVHKNRRIKNFFKAIIFTPIRYSQLMFDLFVMGKFIIDLWVTKNRQWRK